MLILVSGATTTVKKLNSPYLGALITPDSANDVKKYSEVGMPWALDNGAFSGFDPEAFIKMLAKWQGLPGCLFVVAPDVVGDAYVTRVLFSHWEPVIRRYGYPVAFVAQDGIQYTEIPWQRFGALFIGGSTAFKLGPMVADLVREAKSRGKWVHMGRVNSNSRQLYASSLDIDSIDGTGFSMFPSQKLPTGIEHAKVKQSRMEDIA